MKGRAPAIVAKKKGGDIPINFQVLERDSKKRASKSWALLLPDHLAHHHEKDKRAGLSSLAQVLARGRSEGCTSQTGGKAHFLIFCNKVC